MKMPNGYLQNQNHCKKALKLIGMYDTLAWKRKWITCIEKYILKSKRYVKYICMSEFNQIIFSPNRTVPDVEYIYEDIQSNYIFTSQDSVRE